MYHNKRLFKLQIGKEVLEAVPRFKTNPRFKADQLGLARPLKFPYDKVHLIMRIDLRRSFLPLPHTRGKNRCTHCTVFPPPSSKVATGENTKTQPRGQVKKSRKSLKLTIVSTRLVEASGNTRGAVTSPSRPFSLRNFRKISWLAASFVKSSSSNMEDLCFGVGDTGQQKTCTKKKKQNTINRVTRRCT